MGHDLKTWPEPFAAVLSGAKRAEVRKADRNYSVGDTLVLREWSPKRAEDIFVSLWEKYRAESDGDLRGAEASARADAIHRAYTGRECRRRVTHILQGGQFGIEAGYVVLSLEEAAHDHA
jgi:hypothetical protein